MSLLLSVLVACKPSEPECVPFLEVYEDLDGDGYGSTPLDRVCELGEGQALDGGDCDDDDPVVNPENKEKCNGLDDDCDGEVDDGTDRTLWFADEDGDGFGSRYPSRLECDKPDGDWADNDADCDDTDAEISPDGREVCAGGDEDCDGLAGDFDPSVAPGTYETFYRDADGDGYGTDDTSTEACWAPSGYVANTEDCDDSDPTFTRNLYYVDADGDGYGDASNQVSGCTAPPDAVINDDDCDDGDADITNEHDWYEDTDGDGYGDGASLGYSCESPLPDLVAATGDCAPDDPAENPGTLEVCDDGLDQNCDGAIDCDDTDCAAVCLPPCADDTLTGPLPITFGGSTNGQGNDLSGSCGGASAPELAYWWTPANSGNVTIDTAGSNYDTLLYVLQGCGGVSLACNDDAGGALGLNSRVNVNVTAGVPVLIVVDGFSGPGAFVLNIQ